MAYTVADLDTIKAAIASGTKSMRLNNRQVEYHTVSQMIQAKELIEMELVNLGLITKERRPIMFRVSCTRNGL
jgi:hypothetical protein